jgi:hypothetical protein
VILHAALLEPIKEIYKVKEKQVDINLLEKMLSKLQIKYSTNILLTSTVQKMLELNPSNRPTCLEIQQKLP